MCLTTKFPRAVRAKKDIICYKEVATHRGELILTLTNTGKFRKGWSFILRAQYQEFQYELGKTYRTRITSEAYGQTRKVHHGFHSYKFDRSSTKKNAFTTIECVIPKGAYYYEGSNHDGSPGYCANTLKVVKIV